MIKSLKTLPAQGYLWRLPLAVVFCYAAIEKIIDPADFARTIHNYRLLPLEAVAPLAITLPWVEIWAGLLVLTRSWGKAAALILAGLLTVFMLAVGFNLARGLDFECGCFGSGGRQAGLNLLWQDSLLLICALRVLKPRLSSEEARQKHLKG